MSTDAPPSTIVSSPELSAKYAIPLSSFFTQHPRHNFLATGSLVFHQDKLLIVQRAATDSFPGCWENPGGGCDLTDESILHGVARELWEETGLHATRIVRQVGEMVEFQSSSGKPIAKVTFEVETCETQRTGAAVAVLAEESGRHDSSESSLTDRIPIKLDPHEHQAFLWVTEEQVQHQRIAEGDDTSLMLDFISPDQHYVMLEGFRLRRGKESSVL